MLKVFAQKRSIYKFSETELSRIFDQKRFELTWKRGNKHRAMIMSVYDHYTIFSKYEHFFKSICGQMLHFNFHFVVLCFLVHANQQLVELLSYDSHHLKSY